MHVGGYCPGCGGGPGNQSCAIARCSLAHDNVAYCFQCKEYPCSRYENIEAYDSFITHQRQLSDMARAKAIGLDAYNKEQDSKVAILQELLSNYNDGRRKTFYCIAVNLLPLEDLESAMKQLSANSVIYRLAPKEKADEVTSVFLNLAKQQGLVLKLRKKPVKK